MDDDGILAVTPASRAHLQALLHGDATFEREFGMRVAAGLIEFDGMLEHAVAALDDGVEPRWSTHLFVHRADRALIGIGGFTGPPEQGAVEIGYSVAPEYRGSGFATAAARRLVAAAEQSGDVRLVVAHTLAAAGPSTAILQRLGFVRVGEAVDPEEGPVWRWELDLGTPGPAA
jgi:[ribosomal protein S5]-alanine N-acetyltransferase